MIMIISCNPKWNKNILEKFMYKNVDVSFGYTSEPLAPPYRNVWNPVGFPDSPLAGSEWRRDLRRPRAIYFRRSDRHQAKATHDQRTIKHQTFLVLEGVCVSLQKVNNKPLKFQVVKHCALNSCILMLCYQCVSYFCLRCTLALLYTSKHHSSWHL